MKLLLYCVKANPYLVKRNIFAGVEPSYFVLNENVEDKLNGKIVAECDFEVEEINCSSVFNRCYATWNLGQDELLKFSCLERKQLVDYLGCENQIDGKWCGYAIHIKNLKIFDKPRELSEYYTKKKNNVEKDEDLFMDGILHTPIKSAPQNMMYAKQLLREDKILISIQPQWLCKILNKEKTIEIRKKVLKGMIK